MNDFCEQKYIVHGLQSSPAGEGGLHMTVIDDLRYRATLMSKDTPIAEIHSHRVIPIRNDLVPLCFKDGKGDFGEWLEGRAADRTRPHVRLLKKVLRLKEHDDISTTLHVNAVTLTDCYWVRPEDSSLTWEDIRFRRNEFADLALKGDLSHFSKEPSLTPELTNTGSFEKGWKFEGGEWWLYKEATELQKFSELFVYEICKELGFAAAIYEDCGEYVRTKDFTEQRMCLEPAAYLMGEEEDYVDNYQKFLEFGEEIADQYLEIIMIDAFCRNADRHTHNYGLLRGTESGEILRMAPNFDNNISLLSKGYEKSARGDDFFAKELRRLEAETGAISEYGKRHELPVVTAEMIAECCERTGIEVDVGYVVQYVMAGYKYSGIPEMIERLSVAPVLAAAEKRCCGSVGCRCEAELGL